MIIGGVTMGQRNVLPEGTRDLILNECIVKKQLERDLISGDIKKLLLLL